jgi:hypothetical protein
MSSSPHSGFRIALLCFLVAATIRLSILFGTGLYLKLDRTEMASVAVTFAHTGQLGNPYMALPTGPTAHVAPVYPLLLGMIYRLFGDGKTGEIVKQIVASCVSSARAPLLVLLTLTIGFGGGVALVAGLCSAMHIGAFETELKGDWEGPMAANALLILVISAYRIGWRRLPTSVEALCYGLGWGVALLIAPGLLPVGVGLALLGCAAAVRKAMRDSAKVLLLFALGCMLALSPWVIRNHLVLGGLVWGRDNFGLELSVSNGPGASWSNPENHDRIYSMHPSRYLPAAKKLREQGELAFEADRKREGLEWIRTHPREFAGLTANRIWHFWFPSGRNRAHQIALAALTLLAIAGLAVMWRLSNPGFMITVTIWTTYPALYYIIQWSSRYRQPIEWSLILSASVAVYEGYVRTKHALAASIS